MSFDEHLEPSAPTQSPSRPPPGRPATTALIGRVRPWIDWIGTGRIVTTAVVAVAVVAGGWWLLRTPPPPTEASLPYAATSTAPLSVTTTGAPAPPTTADGAPAEVVVHVAGAVVEPGVYALPAGSRVDVAIDAAGGPLREASPDALNLAAPLVDGERIYVPAVGESVPIEVVDTPTGSAPTTSGPIDVNHATIEQLDELPGIGPTTAAAIIDHREQNGPFATVDDLEDVRGIGPAKLDAIRDLVTV